MLLPAFLPTSVPVGSMSTPAGDAKPEQVDELFRLLEDFQPAVRNARDAISREEERTGVRSPGRLRG